MSALHERLWPLLEAHLFSVPSTDRLFNPYFEADDPLGVPGAFALRRTNLAAYLNSFPDVPPVLAVAEAPGYRGCRFSGVPLTSERQLVEGAFGGGFATSLAGPYGEQSATLAHRIHAAHPGRVLFWNAVPLHPHRAHQPLTNRTPTFAEVARWLPLLEGVVAALQPASLVAVGRIAERALTTCGRPSTYVRHPAQGGARAFAEGLRALLQSGTP